MSDRQPGRVEPVDARSTENGQTLPSPWYYYDDIQYFAPGPEFKLSREAAAQKAYKADLQAQALQAP